MRPMGAISTDDDDESVHEIRRKFSLTHCMSFVNSFSILVGGARMVVNEFSTTIIG